MKTIKLQDYQVYTVKEAIEAQLGQYLNSDAQMCSFDISIITSLLESMYALGFKQDARTYRKEFREFIKDSDLAYGERLDTLEELKAVSFAA